MCSLWHQQQHQQQQLWLLLCLFCRIFIFASFLLRVLNSLFASRSSPHPQFAFSFVFVSFPSFVFRISNGYRLFQQLPGQILQEVTLYIERERERGDITVCNAPWSGREGSTCSSRQWINNGLYSNLLRVPSIKLEIFNYKVQIRKWN